MLEWIIAGVGAAAGPVLVVRRAFVAWRHRVCPVCKSRELTRLNSVRWDSNDGAINGGARITYRCVCGEELLEEYAHGLAPMTRSQHNEWRKTHLWRKPLPRAKVHRRRRS